MKIMKLISVVLCFIYFAACSTSSIDSKTTAQANSANNSQANQISETKKINAEINNPVTDTNIQNSSGNQPKTIRDFFMLLPEKYFVAESCEPEKDKGCQKAKVDYLKRFTDVEDTANGYLKGGCDGAQSCLEMALFKRADGTYIVGLATSAEMSEKNYFLDYKNGIWSDVSSKVVPNFSKKNMYELPRYGTVVKVFAKKILEEGDDYEISEKGAKLYDLEWKDGKFAIKK